MSIATTVLAEQLMTLHTDGLTSTPYSEENFCGDGMFHEGVRKHLPREISATV